jgi:hypothetical protein
VSVDHQARALALAETLAEVMGELLRYAREGAYYRRPPFGDVELAEKLADVLKTTLEIESDEQSREGFTRDDADERNWMLGACSRFLDGWVP